MIATQTKLRYLFEAIFEDGETFTQNEFDVSLTHPGKSSYFDLMKIGKKIAYFRLLDIDSLRATACVSLISGLFEVRGISLKLQPSTRPIPEGGKYSLVYFRDHVAKLNTGSGEASDEHSYRIGWLYSFEGKTWEQTIVID